MNSVVSRDGTRIGYTQTGQGPGLILVQGAMATAYNFRDLAQALSSDFTVYAPDRRGRGMSPRPYTPDHTIQRDIEDIQALSLHSDAGYIFGLSSGAIIALICAGQLDSIQKAVLYEPPFYLKRGIDKVRVEQFNQEIVQGRLVHAMTTAGEIAQLAPLPIRVLPRPLRLFATGRFMRRLDDGNGYAPLKELLPAMRYDFRIVGEMSQKMQVFKTVNKDTLLLGGTKIPRYLQLSLIELEKTIPKARRITLPDLSHSAPWNTDRGGAPLIVAAAIRSFLQKASYIAPAETDLPSH